MSGLYIHIPFCKSRCAYCAFYSQTNPHLQEVFVKSLCQELKLRQDELMQLAPFESLYFGGGTPSLLSPHFLEQILSFVAPYLDTSPTTEWTLEGNPDDLTPSYARAIRALGFNRVSLGVQSFQDEELRFLGRRHTTKEVYRALDALREVSIDNISIDLIYGLPAQSRDVWQRNVAEALSLYLPHLSAYNLTYEEKTRLSQLALRGRVVMQSDEEALQDYDYLVDALAQAGYDHYELSNFAFRGKHSRHNSSYWQRIPYLGFGPSAHSYIPESRYANVANLKQYIKLIQEGQKPSVFREELSLQDCLNEWIMVALRTSKGIDLQLISEIYGTRTRASLIARSRPYLEQGLLELGTTIRYSLEQEQLPLVVGEKASDAPYLRATRTGILLVDTIISDLFDL